MRPLSLYFNELSSSEMEPDARSWSEWQNCATRLFTCLREASRQQQEFELVFPEGHWHGLCGAKPLSAWMKDWLGRDNYRWLLARIRNRAAPRSDDCEVRFASKSAAGLTFAHLAGSWAVSFPVSNSPWTSEIVAALEFRLDAEGVSECNCEIRNLAHEGHACHWAKDLADWGCVLADNYRIGNVAGYAIAMYPLDHLPPHIHLIDPESFTEVNGRRRPKTLAKYRVDRLELMEGASRWNNEMYLWIEDHREALLRSWDRCQRGYHPYCITD